MTLESYFSKTLKVYFLRKESFFEWTNGSKVVIDTRRCIIKSDLPFNVQLIHCDQAQLDNVLEYYPYPLSTFYIVAPDDVLIKMSETFNLDIRMLVVNLAILVRPSEFAL